jgi:hypothetical protein
MNIQTVANNLRATIAGKEKMLAEFESTTLRSGANLEAVFATKEFLKINIAELNRILDDLVECQVKGVEQSWRDNPDRSGGQFTEDEIDNAGAWR